jgi:(R,R)-butanediol dehydrogenase/meso-butanediol dehydrogenase/diacetyl reductase
MRAAVVQEVGKPLAIETVPDPKPAADQVILEVSRCGICGSDLHITQFGFCPPGTILGHEFAGTIVEVGDDVRSGWKVGERVTALPLMPCSNCEYCDQGLHSLCHANRFVGTALNTPGAYAEYVAVRADMLQRLPTGVGFDEGAMVEPLAVAYHAVDRGEPRRDTNVLVIGAGPIGLGAALFARLRGARNVVVSEFAPERRKRALDMGATHVIDPKSETVAERFAEIAGGAPDMVIECVGVPGLIQQSINLVRPRGRVVVVGVCFEADTIQPMSAISKEADIVFAQCYTPRDFGAVIDAIAVGAAKPQPMLTETVGFDALPERFESLRTPSTQCKILIDPALNR